MKQNNKEESPFFSVVIPTYNHEFFLEKAVQSVLNQTFKNYEIIIIDNHSNDNTENLIKNLKSEKIKFIKTHNDGIIAKSRNIGINNSKSEWIAFLDSDDLWYKNKLEVLFNFLEKNNNYDVICNDELVVDEIHNKKKIWKHGPLYWQNKKNFYKILLKYGNYVSVSASIVRKKFLVDNKIYFSEEKNFSPTEDYDFWLRIAKNEAKFKFLDTVLGEHLFHLKSWGSKNKIIFRESERSQAKYHVFNMQNFTSSKKNLWSYIESRLIIEDIMKLLLENKYFKALIIFVKLITKYPIQSTVHIYFKIKRIF